MLCVCVKLFRKYQKFFETKKKKKKKKIIKFHIMFLKIITYLKEVREMT